MADDVSARAESISRPRAAQTVLLVDDHDLLRLGFRALVHAQAAPRGAVVDVLEAASLAEALRLYDVHADAIRLVFLDLGLPDTDGLSGLQVFRERFPGACIVVLSGTGDATHARRALELGAAAFLPKSADLKEVVSFIRATGLFESDSAAAAQGGTGDGPRGFANPPAIVAQHQLTPRQAQVLAWVLQGRPNKEIAQLANVSEGTVKNHVSTLLLLYGVRSRAQLISSLR